MQTDMPLKVSEQAHCARLGDQVIVADMRSGRYFGLDDVGAIVWTMIEARTTRGAIVDRVHAEYEVSRDVLERDVDRLLDDLLKRRLVEYAATPAGGGG